MDERKAGMTLGYFLIPVFCGAMAALLFATFLFGAEFWPKRKDNREDDEAFLRYKQALFFAASGQVEKVKPSVEAVYGIEIGSYLRKELQNGKTFEQIMFRQRQLSNILDRMSGNSNESQALLLGFLRSQNISVPEELVDMATYNGKWRKFSEDDQNLKILQGILGGKQEVPYYEVSPSNLSIISKSDIFFTLIVI